MLNPMKEYSLVILQIAKAYRVFNKRTMVVDESIHVFFFMRLIH
jgi:hypothetical protein